MFSLTGDYRAIKRAGAFQKNQWTTSGSEDIFCAPGQVIVQVFADYHPDRSGSTSRHNVRKYMRKIEK